MFHRRSATQEQQESFGRVLREARIQKNLTQEELSERLSCSPHWINNIENGKSSPNWVDTINLLIELELDPKLLAEEVGILVPVPANRK